MAKLKAFSVHDSKLDAWNPPMFLQHAGQAERTFEEIANDAGSLISKHPADFTLYIIGEFDDATGALHAHPPVQLTTALAVKQKPREAQLPLQSVR